MVGTFILIFFCWYNFYFYLGGVDLSNVFFIGPEFRAVDFKLDEIDLERVLLDTIDVSDIGVSSSNILFGLSLLVEYF